MKSNYQVTKRENGRWAVIREGGRRAASVHSTQKEAQKAIRVLVHKRQRKSPKLVSQKTQGSMDGAHNRKGEEKKEAFLKQFGARLKRARLMRGYSLRALADQLEGVSHTRLQQFEKGEKSSDTAVLVQLGQALKVQSGYFFKRDGVTLESIEYRKASKVGKKLAHQLSEQACEFFERYLEVEQILGVEQEALPAKDLSKVQKEDLAEKIEEWTIVLRSKWDLGSNPIANVHSTLEKNGVKVRLLPDAEGFDGLSGFALVDASDQKKVPTIAVSNEFLESDIPRLRFTLLHELGHLAMKLPEHLEHKEKEGCCHRFASAFLFPKDSFTETFGQKRKKFLTAEFKEAKAEWGMSIAAMMRRARDLDVITAGNYKGFCIWNNSAKGLRKSGEPQTWSGSESSNRFEQFVFRAFAEEMISHSKAANLMEMNLGEFAERAEELLV